MAKMKYFNKTTQRWEYAETGNIPERGTHYWIAQDLQPLRDYVYGRVMAAADVCFLTVSVTSNQPDKSALEGLVLDVTFPDGKTEKMSAGSVIGFTEGSVTVQFPEVAGYKRPDNISVPYAKGSVTQQVTYLAEQVTVNSLVDGAASDEFSYEVSGDGIVCLTGSGTSFTGVTKWLVPHGVTITVTPSTVDGYTANAITHTASGVTGSVSVVWTETFIGAAIMDINGKFYMDTESWLAAGSPTANGVAVSDGTHRLCIAKDIVENVCNGDTYGADTEYWGANGIEVSGVYTTTNTSITQDDFSGVENTDAIVANVTSSDGYFIKAPWSAAGLCRQFTFPNGSKGYLGALGEWRMVGDTKSQVNNLLVAIGGTRLQVSTVTNSYAYYWSSTQRGPKEAWVWDLSGNADSYAYSDKNGTKIRVRAFCTC